MTDRMSVFHQWLKERGLKSTSQRDDIAQVFFATNRHLSVEELYAEVRKINPRVGYATVTAHLNSSKNVGLLQNAILPTAKPVLKTPKKRATMTTSSATAVARLWSSPILELRNSKSW